LDKLGAAYGWLSRVFVFDSKGTARRTEIMPSRTSRCRLDAMERSIGIGYEMRILVISEE
jgi:hypothetical protein